MTPANIESGVQLFARIRENACSASLNYPLFPNGVCTKECIEILGEHEPANALVLDFTVRSILPREYDGNEVDTILLNTEHNFNIPVLIGAIQHAAKGHKFDRKALIEDCMKRLTLLNCYNSDQLKFSFMHLEQLLQENERIKVIVVDSLHTYYWMDKLNLTMISYQKYCSNMATDLINIIKDFTVLLIYKSINNEMSTKSKGFKRNYIVNISRDIDNKYKLHLVEDDTLKEQIEVRIKPYVIYS